MEENTIIQKNVFMASLAFLVPLQGSWLRYRKICKDAQKCNDTQKGKDEQTCNDGQKIESPYALFPNAECRCYSLDNWRYGKFFFPFSFSYTSCYDGVTNINRKIDVVKPWLMKLSLKDKHIKRFFLVLTIQIDKVFGNKQVYDESDFCTEYDIVNLKKSLFENTVSGYYTERKICFQDWVQSVVTKLDGRKRVVRLSYSAIELSTQRIDVSITNNDIKTVNNSFKDKYYSGGDIDNFLQTQIDLPNEKNQTNHLTINNGHFVYGLLYANDNFMMADSSTVQNTINDYYSNNKVERYWADDECLVHIKTGTPYFQPRNEHDQVLTKDAPQKDLPLLFDIAMLAFLKCELQKFMARHKYMSSLEIEEHQSMLAEILYGKLFNQTEMDKRMDYFIKKFHLVKLFRDIQSVVVPNKSSKEMSFLHVTTVYAIVVGVLTLLATLIGIFISLYRS